MVSALWKACSDGDLDTVLAVLNTPAPVDLELTDSSGATPLIEAVRNGHIEVVRALLSKGANPSNGSSLGRPDQLTSDLTIHELLRGYQVPANVDPGHENVYADDDPSKNYYPPPPPHGAYTYYPTINPALSPMGEGGYYPPQQMQQGGENSPTSAGIGHLPPPEVARLIPCRYFPACRYGPQCMFAHPQGPYYANNTAPPPPPPQAQYPPFDPALGHPYGYYPGPPPPPFQQPNGAPLSPPSHLMHGRSPSELVSPGPFLNGGPPPPPMGPYGPMSPSSYPHPGHVSVSHTLPPLPPVHHQPPSGPVPHSPTAAYNGSPAPFPGVDGQYYPPPPVGYSDMDSKLPVSPGQPDSFNPPGIRDNNGARRGTGVRRGSFVKSGKPPCMFFPSGRCKNGDDCRFPHVLSENQGPNHTPNFYPARGGASRPARGITHVNGIATINQKMGNMAVRDDASRPQNGITEDSSRSQSTDSGNRSKYQQGYNKHQNGVNGKRPNLNSTPIRPQRVPSAEDFPVLPGSITPPKRNGVNGLAAVNGHLGPTAAQILLAPPPIRKENSRDSASSSVRGPSPETTHIPEEPETELIKAVIAPEQQVATVVPAPTPATPAPAPAVQKLPLSFAAAAASASAPAPEVSKEVFVSA